MFLFILLTQQFTLTAQKLPAQITLNQVGYYPNATKIAIVTGKVPSGLFYIVTADGEDTLYEGTLDRERRSAYSPTITRIADFSSFAKTGNFILRFAGSKQSFPFRIENNVYNELGKAVLKGFYFQRW